MSSATTVKNAGAPLPSEYRRGERALDTSGEPAFRPWHFFVLASLLAATAAVILSRRSTPEHLILMSLTIAAAGLAAAGFYRMLSPLAVGDFAGSAEPMSARTRATLEREKMLALRSIKELEFDRAMGKLSPKDFDEMSARLRSRAMSLMKQLDTGESGYRQLIERDLESRLSERRMPQSPGVQGQHVCGGCGTVNDADASYCKRCGNRLVGQ